MKCNLCNKNEGNYLCLNIDTSEQFYVCDWCEFPQNAKILEDLGLPLEKLSNVSDKPIENMGRLHLVRKSIKESECRVCKTVIPKGSKCFRQNVYEGNAHFPKQTKCCEKCSEDLIAKWGIKIV